MSVASAQLQRDLGGAGKSVSFVRPPKENMVDLPDIDFPKSAILAVLRFIWWLGWELLVETVFWAVGWLALRTLTLGRYPAERLGEQDAASWSTAFIVQAVGACLLATSIGVLSGAWPIQT